MGGALATAFRMVFFSSSLQPVIFRTFSERLVPKDGCHLTAGCLGLLVDLPEWKDGKTQRAQVPDVSVVSDL